MLPNNGERLQYTSHLWEFIPDIAGIFVIDNPSTYKDVLNSGGRDTHSTFCMSTGGSNKGNVIYFHYDTSKVSGGNPRYTNMLDTYSYDRGTISSEPAWRAQVSRIGLYRKTVSVRTGPACPGRADIASGLRCSPMTNFLYRCSNSGNVYKHSQFSIRFTAGGGGVTGVPETGPPNAGSAAATAASPGTSTSAPSGA